MAQWASAERIVQAIQKSSGPLHTQLVLLSLCQMCNYALIGMSTRSMQHIKTLLKTKTRKTSSQAIKGATDAQGAQ